MATELNKDAELKIPVLNDNVKGNFYVFMAEWNSEITVALNNGAVRTLKKAGVSPDRIKNYSVPGTVELVNAAAVALSKEDTAAVIVIGCVVRGDTPHFDYVCQIVSQGVARLNSLGKAPVIFGVLTVDNYQQALDRAGGMLGNKGDEAAVAAIDMAGLGIRL